MRGTAKVETVDAYLKAAPAAARARLVELRKLVKSVAPEASEGISYGMPYYKQDGALVGFAAFKNHIGFFPGAIVRDFADDLKGYEIAKGTVRLPLDKPLPVALLRKLLKAGLVRNAAKAAARKRTA